VMRYAYFPFFVCMFASLACLLAGLLVCWGVGERASVIE